MVGNGKGAKSGIFFKTAASLEEAGRIQIVALDKTGTITKGEPKVTDIIPAKAEKSKLLSYAYSLEKKSEHPLAKAICDYAQDAEVDSFETDEFKALAGNGLVANAGDKKIIGGSLKFISSQISVDDTIKEKASSLSKEGKTPLFFACDDELLGIIAVADVIKEESPKAIKELQNMGIRVVMLTGDNEKTAKAIGKQIGVDNVISDVLPDGKENVIKELMSFGKVAMVGDGINDAPVLTRADIGIAMGAMGSDAAIEAADIVLMDDNPHKIATAMKIARKTISIVHQNIVFALGVKALILILGALGMADMWGAVFADVGVSIIAILNAMRAMRVAKEAK